MQVLVVDPPNHALPRAATALLREFGWNLKPASNYREALSAAGDGAIDAAILPEAGPETAPPDELLDFENLLRVLDARRIAAVVLTDRPRHAVKETGSLMEAVQRNISADELRGRLAVIERYQGLIKRMERELANMQHLGNRLHRHFQEMDQEMRLAGRLQRDFLPELREPIANLQFAAVYRPANWVSGDMFDVFRLNDEYTGFYVVDAVGHGLAASLLTMFIKRAIVSQRVEPGGDRVLTPSETMVALNNVLTDQALPNCQFVTACYCLFHHPTRTLHFARGGHPYPILVSRGGAISDLNTPGGLLGIFGGEDFPTQRTQLHPGDKLVLYTDGVEFAFSLPTRAIGAVAPTPLHTALEKHGSLPIGELFQRLDSSFDAGAGSLDPRDDLTLLGVEVLP